MLPTTGGTMGSTIWMMMNPTKKITTIAAIFVYVA
jgi:hypothetical protein